MRRLATIFALTLLGGVPSAGAWGWHRGHPAPGSFGYRGRSACRGAGFGLGYRLGPSWRYANPRLLPPPPPYIPLTNEERYQGAKQKGDRAADRGDWPKAIAQYRDAQGRATRFWGQDSRQAQEATALLQRAETKFRVGADAAPGGSFREAMGRADRAMVRGDWRRAEAGYRKAVLRARSVEQARQAAGLAEAAHQRAGGRGGEAE